MNPQERKTIFILGMMRFDWGEKEQPDYYNQEPLKHLPLMEIT